MWHDAQQFFAMVTQNCVISELPFHCYITFIYKRFKESEAERRQKFGIFRKEEIQLNVDCMKSTQMIKKQFHVMTALCKKEYIFKTINILFMNDEQQAV
jgi:hypothetical protein